MSDPEIDKILNKAFEDIKKRVNSYIAKREKKVAKENKVDAKPTHKKSKPRKESTSSESSESR
jgi:hypothetical protein